MQVFVIINKNGIKINADVNVLSFIDVVKNFVGILVVVFVIFKKKVAHLLIDECEENISEDEMIKNKAKSVYKYNKSQLVEKYKPFVALFILFLLVSLIISGIFVYYFNSHSKSKRKDIYKAYY